MMFERYWMFAVSCLIVVVFLVRMVVAEQLTLQTILSFLMLLLFGAAIALFPNVTAWVASRMGFSLPSNFFFSVMIAALAFLHLSALVHLSRVQLRSVTLTQELALLQEKVDRALRAVEQSGARGDARGSSG
jgi:hypothetical protein